MASAQIHAAIAHDDLLRALNATLPPDVRVLAIDDVPLGGDHGDYSVVKVDGRGVAGMVAMDDAYPPEVPSHWLPYFAVDDADDTVRRAEKLGARVTASPTSVPTVGRFATLSGRHGEAFAVIRNE